MSKEIEWRTIAIKGLSRYEINRDCVVRIKATGKILPYAELKNNFLKNQVIRNSWYDLLKEKKDDESITLLERLSLLFKDQKHSNMSEREAATYIQSMEEDM